MKAAVSFSVSPFVLAAAAFLAPSSPRAGAQSAAAPSKAELAAPVNLKVLAGQNLTVRQVREIMNDWADQLGTDCSTCHVRNTKQLTSYGRPRYDYADDSKQEKKTARVMYSMTETINTQFIATVPNSGVPVTCGTCHRGHLTPEADTSPEKASKGSPVATEH